MPERICDNCDAREGEEHLCHCYDDVPVDSHSS